MATANTQTDTRPHKAKKLGHLLADPQVTAARFSPDGAFLAAGGFDGRVYLWKRRVPEQHAEKTASEASTQTAKAAAPSRTAADRVATDVAAQWEALPAIERHHGWVQALAFLGDQNVLICGDSWGGLSATRLEGSQPQLLWHRASAHDGWLRDLAVTPDARLVVTCGRDRTVRVFEALSGKLVRKWQAGDEDLLRVAVSPDGGRIATGDLRGRICEWNLADGTLRRRHDASALWTLHRLQDVGGVRVLKYTSDGKQLIAGGTRPKNGGNVQGAPLLLVFGPDDSTARQITLGATSDVYVTDLQFHPQGLWIVTTSGNPGTGKLHFLESGADKPVFTEASLSNCHAVSLSPREGFLAVTATNPNSNGNGRKLDENGNYVGNKTLIRLLQLV